MFHLMYDNTRHDRIRNENNRVGIGPIVENMVKTRLRWSGHAERRPLDFVVRRGRGRP